jgi:hypothetical protein
MTLNASILFARDPFLKTFSAAFLGWLSLNVFNNEIADGSRALLDGDVDNLCDLSTKSAVDSSLFARPPLAETFRVLVSDRVMITLVTQALFLGGRFHFAHIDWKLRLAPIGSPAAIFCSQLDFMSQE